MSYDLRGQWDSAIWAHNNISDIAPGLDAVWKMGVDPSQVLLGLAFFGHSFTATNPSCLEPGCPHKGMGTWGECSKSDGILWNNEIDQLIQRHNVKPKFYKEATVKVATWGDQFVGYDDEETLQMKADYARNKCMGGLMVWSTSQDTPDARYNRAVAKIAGRSISARSRITGRS